MKKLLAVLVVLTLIAGVVSAQVSVGGQVQAGAIVIGGSSTEDSDVIAGKRPPNPTTGLINARAGDDKAGAFVRVHSRTDGTYYSPTAFTFAWWKPIEQLRLQFGINNDGDWGAAQITGWGFNAEAQEFVAVDQWSGEGIHSGSALNGSGHTNLEALVRMGFYGGFKSNYAVAASIIPNSNFSINIGLPYGDDLDNVGNVYMSSHVNFNIKLEDIGRLNISYQGGGLQGADNDEFGGADIFVSFYLMAIENLGLDIGVDIPLAAQDADMDPIKVGLGVRFGIDDFAIKARIGAALGGVSDKNTYIGLNLLPSLNVGSSTIFLNLGAGFFIPEGDGDVVVPWYVNPYVAVPAGGIKFYAGFKLSSDGIGGGDAIVNWAVPVGVNIYF